MVEQIVRVRTAKKDKGGEIKGRQEERKVR
jgi:hypothetical protein